MLAGSECCDRPENLDAAPRPVAPDASRPDASRLDTRSMTVERWAYQILNGADFRGGRAAFDLGCAAPGAAILGGTDGGKTDRDKGRPQIRLAPDKAGPQMRLAPR